MPRSKKTKLCKGPLHREGVMVSIYQFSKLNEGRRAGKLVSQCKDCTRVYHNRDVTQSIIYQKEFQPIIDKLYERIPNKQEIARRAGLAINFLHIKRTQMRYYNFVKLKALYEKIRKEPWTDEFKATARPFTARNDPQVVPSEFISPLLKQFVDHWRGVQDAENSFDENNYGPLRYLADQAGMGVRTISTYLNSPPIYTALGTADRLLVALGKHELLSMGQIPIVKNPYCSDSRYEEYISQGRKTD